jgi:hypothetical protein
MGILRTNTVSGIETPTPVTGSVVFDGNGDYLSLASSGDFGFGTGDFTIEFWLYRTNTGNNVGFIDTRSTNTDTNGWFIRFNSATTIQLVDNATQYITITHNSTWNHIAFVRKSGVITGYINGNFVASTNAQTNFTSSNLLIAAFVDVQSSPNAFTGYISNLRILKGTALYTENFTPPTRELQPIGDTVLLCCNNSTSATAEATGKTITANGNAVASTFSPGLVRDFTYGTQFDGVSKFDTQGYFVPPSGNTQNRYTLGLDEIVTDGLVLHLDAGNPFSYPVTGVGTKWTDLSGNNNHGTLNGGVSYTENNRGSLVFDGSNDYVDCGNLNTLSNMTVQMFVKPLSNPGLYEGFIGAVGGTGNDYDSGFNIDMGLSSTSTFNYCNFEGGIYRIGGGSNFMTSSIPFGTWVNICFTISPTYIQCYINGITQLGSNRLNNVTSTIGMNNLVIGRRPLPSTFLSGDISNTQIYNRALTASEVQQNYNALKGRYGHS